MTTPVFRFAPSPNGRLHLGHAYSALLNWKMAQESIGRFLLRIEDTDVSRCRPEFVDGIYEDLHWLGLNWELPVRVQSRHFSVYRANVERLRAMGKCYPCFCSRKEAAAAALASRDPDGQPLYGGTCRTLSLDEADRRIAAGEVHGWRLDMAACNDPQAAVWGDVMIAKFETGSSYHIAVVSDDAVQGITHVVRGKDLEAATSVHRLLQSLLGLPHPEYFHHDLIRDAGGEKLSKSLRSTALASLRTDGVTPADIRQQLGFA